MKSIFLLTAVLLATFASGQERSLRLFAGGEIAEHLIGSPRTYETLTFDFGASRGLRAEAEESFYVGIAKNWRVPGKPLTVQTQVDYGSVLYSSFFQDATERNGIFGPLRRSIFYASPRLDFSIQLGYAIGKNRFRVLPLAGIGRSFHIEQKFVPERASRPRHEAAIAIVNALNASFGRSVWKTNLGAEFTYRHLALSFNWRWQLTSGSARRVPLAVPEGSIEFDNRQSSLQFALGYYLF